MESSKRETSISSRNTSPLHDGVCEKFPAGPVIPLICQDNLLRDNNRTNAFVKSVSETVREDDIVIDLGAGVGLLSFAAVDKAKKVYAVEIDHAVFDFGKKLSETMGLADKIEWILGDARYVKIPEAPDLVICEMLDTALMSELQVPVMNRVIHDSPNHDMVILPKRTETSVHLLESSFFNFQGIEFRLPRFEMQKSRRWSRELSEPQTYHRVSYREFNNPVVKAVIRVKVTNKGVLNAIRLESHTSLDEHTLVGPSDWFCPPVVFPVNPIDVSENQTVSLEIGYEMGQGFDSVTLQAN